MKNKHIFKFGATTLLPLMHLSAACVSNEENWDSEITISNAWINEGFQNTTKEAEFLETITKRFNELKNQRSDTKNMPNVSFKIAVNYDKNLMLNNLKADKITDDVAILPYSLFAEELKNQNNIDNFAPKLIANTNTLQFTWSIPDNAKYVDGSLENDPLRQGANAENEKQFKAFGEFPNWYSSNETTLQWDGSKYKTFYKSNQTTGEYHGAIIISGNKAQRSQIIEAWNSKNWNDFISHGIIFKKNSSGSGYKYQIALLSKHFNKSIDAINQELNQENNQNVLKGSDPIKQIGKIQNTNQKAYHIGFVTEGEFNWTESKENTNKFRPTNYNAELANDYENETNDVVRLLTLTEAAPYDAVLGRAGLNEKQKELLQATLSSLSIEENLYGIYTGYNKFIELDKDLFAKSIQKQLKAEGHDE